MRGFDLAAAMAVVEVPEVQQLTFGELLRGWLASRHDVNDELRLRKWATAFGNRSAWEVTRADLATAARAMEQSGKYKPASIARDVATVGSAYRWAIGRGITPSGFVSPSIGAYKRPDDGDNIRRIYVEPEKLERLLALSLTYRDRRFGLFVHLLADTGARKSELYERRWADLDLDRREIILHTSKNGQPRLLHFGPKTAKLIERICPRRPDGALMFPGRVATEPVDYRSSWSRLTREAGLPGLHMHDVRHDKCRRLLVAGTSIALTASVLGHSPEMTIRRYGHLSTEDARQAVERTWV